MSIATRLNKVRRQVAGLSLATLVLSLFAANTASAAYLDGTPEWGMEAAKKAVELGLFVEDANNPNFNANANANRAQAITVIARAAGWDLPENVTSAFRDVPNNHWAAEEIMEAYTRNVVQGKSAGIFDPAGLITRGDFSIMIKKAFNLTRPAGCTKEWPGEQSHYAADEFTDLYCLSVVNGYGDGRAGLSDPITRVQMAIMLVNALNPVPRGQTTTDFTVMSASPASLTTLKIKFSGEVDPTSGANKANYTITDAANNTITVTGASVSGDTVTLETGTQTANKPYTVTVVNVTSKAGKTLTGTGKATFSGYTERVGGPLTVAVATETPAASDLVTKTANNTVLVLDLTGGSTTDTQVTGIVLEKVGVYADNAVKVVAYDKDGTRLSTGVTFADAKAELSFFNPVVVKSGSPAKIYLKVNISGTAAGNLGLRVANAQSVITNSTSVTGSFPLQSATHRVIDGSEAVATATVDIQTISQNTRSVDIGEKEYEIAKFEIAETSSKEDLKLTSLTIFNNGSVSDTDLKNFVLVDQAGTKLATVERQSNKLVRFDLRQNPYTIGKGAVKIFRVLVDVESGATRTAQLTIQNDFDVELVGATTQASILATEENGGTDDSFPVGDRGDYNEIEINEGDLTVSKANASPSGDINIGASNVVLGAFELKALGEDMQLRRMKISLNASGAPEDAVDSGYMDCTSSACDLTGTVKVAIDANLDGIPDQTIYSTPAQATTLTDLWAADPTKTHELSNQYTIPAGKTVHLLILGDISSTHAKAGEQIQVGIKDIYYEKKASSRTDTAAETLVTANTLTATESQLTVSENTALGQQNVVAQSGAKIGSFIIRAGSAGEVNITSINLRGALECGTADPASGYTNLRMMIGQTALGNPRGNPSFSGNATGDNTYSVNLKVGAGEEKVVDVYADMASNASDVCITIPVDGISGTTASGNAVAGPKTAIDLQQIDVQSSGGLTITLANENPLSQQFVAGTEDNPVQLLRLSATSAEDIYIRKIAFRVDANADDIALASAKLRKGENSNNLTDLESGAVSSWQTDGSNPGYVEWTLSGANRLKVPRNGTLYVGLYMKFTSSSEQNVSGSTPRFTLANIEADGVAKIVPSGSGANRTLTTLKLGSNPSFEADGTCVAVGTLLASDVTISCRNDAGNANTVLATAKAGYYAFIDQNDDATYDSGEEIVYVVAGEATAGSMTVVRGLFGTTAAAAEDGDKIYFLAGIAGNVQEVYNSKPTFSVHASSPTGLQSEGDAKEVFRFTVNAAANTADSNENFVRLNTITITTSDRNMDLANLTIYPAESGRDLNNTYAATCDDTANGNITTWECTLSTAGATNEITEGSPRTYVVRADVHITNDTEDSSHSLEVSIADLGNQTTPGHVNWEDDFGTEVEWVYQQGATQVKPSQAMTF